MVETMEQTENEARGLHCGLAKGSPCRNRCSREPGTSRRRPTRALRLGEVPVLPEKTWCFISNLRAFIGTPGKDALVSFSACSCPYLPSCVSGESGLAQRQIIGWRVKPPHGQMDWRDFCFVGSRWLGLLLLYCVLRLASRGTFAPVRRLFSLQERLRGSLQVQDFVAKFHDW